MLTGDRQETAINIGYSCKLLNEHMDILILNSNSLENTKFQLKRTLMSTVLLHQEQNSSGHLLNMNLEHFNHSSELVNTSSPGNLTVEIEQLNYALVIDGQTLEYIISSGECLRNFVILSSFSRTVICCRTSPLQKAQVVKIVKEHYSFRPYTLAIGDGGNDVSMIQEAHVGVGIYGKEGLQAANSSDYTISRFYHLMPLMLLHGRWNYQRITKTILYSFYKNFLLVIPMFYYSFFNFYSGTALYDSWLIMTYNVFMTAGPVFVLGTLDRDLPEKMVMRNPRVYESGLYSRSFSANQFIRWIFIATVQSCVLFFGLALNVSVINESGHSEDKVVLGSVMFVAVVFTANLTIMLEMKVWTKLFMLLLALSFMSPLMYIPFYDYTGIPAMNLRGVTWEILTSPLLLLAMLVFPLVCLLVNLVLAFGKSAFWPSIIDLLLRSYSNVPSQYMLSDNNDRFSFGKMKKFRTRIQDLFNPKNLNIEKTDFDSIMNDYTMKKYSLEFFYRYMEKAFNIYSTKNMLNYTRFILILFIIMQISWVSIHFYDTIYSSASLIIWKTAYGVYMVFAISFLLTKYFHSYFEYSLICVVSTSLGFMLLLHIIEQIESPLFSVFVPPFIFLHIHIKTYLLSIIITIYTVANLSAYYVTCYNRLDLNVEFFLAVFYITVLQIGVLIVSILVGRAFEKAKRTEFTLKRKRKTQFKHRQQLLRSFLPDFVKEKVKEGVRYICKQPRNICVIFIQILNLNVLLKHNSPEDFMGFLNNFCYECDTLCGVIGITKIEAIEATYLACTGLKEAEGLIPSVNSHKNYIIRALEFGFEVLDMIEGLPVLAPEPIKVRIGIGIGIVIGGVIGEHRPQFSLLGHIVGKTSDICNLGGCENAVYISKSTYKLVHDRKLNFTEENAYIKGQLTKLFLVRQLAKKVKRLRRNTTFNDFSNSTFLTRKTKESKSAGKPTHSEEIDIQRLTTLEMENFKQDDNDLQLSLAGSVQWNGFYIWEFLVEREYRIDKTFREFTDILSGLIVTEILYFLILLGYIIEWRYSEKSRVSLYTLIPRTIAFIGFILLHIFTKRIYKESYFPWIVIVIYSFALIICETNIPYAFDYYYYILSLELLFLHIVASKISGLLLGHVLILSAVTLIYWQVAIDFNDNFIIEFECTAFCYALILLNCLSTFIAEKQDRKSYNLNISAQQEINNTDKLLSQMMPSALAYNIANSIRISASFPSVTVMYVDIKGFHNWAESSTPTKSLSFLSRIYTYFDNFTVKHKVYKVHTIGKTYVVMSLLDINRSIKRDTVEEANAIIDMALSMLHCIAKVNRYHNSRLSLSIGIHTGEITAGFVGSNSYRLDIFSPTVAFTALMERNSTPGNLFITQSTKSLLEKSKSIRFEFSYNGDLYDKINESSYETYFVKVASHS